MNFITRIAICLYLLMQTVALNATNYFVANTGSDSNSGLSLATAFLTIQKAADLVAAGDTAFVDNGIYTGFDLRDVNGAPGSPIVFMALGDSVLINQSGPIRDDGINIENCDFIVIHGFISNDMTGGGNGIRLVNADNCIVRNCRCDNNAERGIFTGFTDDILIEYNICTNSIDEHGIYVSNSSDRPIIRYNECYGNNAIGIHMNGDLSAGGDGIISDAQIYGNIIHDNNHAAGINMDGLKNPVVYNNLIYNNHIAQGIALFQIDGAIATNGAKIYNNTIIVPSDGRWGILVNSGSNVNTEIYNNIIINQHAWRGCITVEDTAQFKSDYNVLNDKLSASGDGSTITLTQWQSLGFDLHSQLADSLSGIFNSPDSNDFQLIMGSQAIDTGTTLVNMIVMSDIVGVIRPSGAGYDVGAYEVPMACDSCWFGSDVVFVDSSATGNSDGTSWSDAFTDLQNAIAIAKEVDLIDEIWIARGTYTPSSDSMRAASFVLEDTMAIYGGFAGGETSKSQRIPFQNIVTLSGNINVPGDATDNVFHVVRVSSSCTNCLIDAVNISDGYANGPSGSQGRGAGILSMGIVTLHDVLIANNYASISGAAVYNTGSTAKVILDKCQLTSNTSIIGSDIMNVNGARIEFRNAISVQND